MNKKHLLKIFICLLFICSFFCIKETIVKADTLEGYSLNILVNGDDVSNGTTLLSYSTDYSNINNLLLTAKLTYENQGDVTNATFVWSCTVNGKAVALTQNIQDNQNQLYLSKTTEDANTKGYNFNMLPACNVVYKVVATINGANIERKININISDTKNESTANIYLNQDVSNGINCLSDYALVMKCLFPKINVQHNIYWFVKAPNHAGYICQEYKGTEFTIEPKTFFTEQNGYGQYSVYAICKTTSSTYPTNVINFNVNSITPSTTAEGFNVTYSKVGNTRSDFEAFKFSINSNTGTKGLNPDNIYWLIDGTFYAKGLSFVYEPITDNAIEVQARYLDADANITSSPLTIKPKATGTWKIWVSIGSITAVLFVCLIVSINKLNKKRDVVW